MYGAVEWIEKGTRVGWGGVPGPKQCEEGIHRASAALHGGVRQCLHMGRVPWHGISVTEQGGEDINVW